MWLLAMLAAIIRVKKYVNKFRKQGADITSVIKEGSEHHD